MAASSPASRAAFRAMSRVMRGSPSVIWSSTVPGTQAKCCSTQPMHERRWRSVIWETSTPPMVTVPFSGRYSPSSSLNTVLLPAPVRPTSVACSPAFTVKERSESTVRPP